MLQFLEGASQTEAKPPDFWLRNVITQSVLKKEHLYRLLNPPEDLEPTSSASHYSDGRTMMIQCADPNHKKAEKFKETDRIHGWKDHYNDYIIYKLKKSSSEDDKITERLTDKKGIEIQQNDLRDAFTEKTSQNKFSCALKHEDGEDEDSIENYHESNENSDFLPTDFSPNILSFDRIHLKPLQALKLNIHDISRSKLNDAIGRNLMEQQELQRKLMEIQGERDGVLEGQSGDTVRMEDLKEEHLLLVNKIKSSEMHQIAANAIQKEMKNGSLQLSDLNIEEEDQKLNQ